MIQVNTAFAVRLPTPFANIFIDPSSANEMLGDDLFPKDFIHLLDPPTNYVGMDVLFSPTDPDRQDAGEDGGSAAGLRTIDDADDWLPVDHKQDAVPGKLPGSLRFALRHFMLACAVRDLRIKAGVEGHERGIHKSMLVNVSRFTAIQNLVAGDLHDELEGIRQQVRLYGRLPANQAESQSPEIVELRRLFGLELEECGFDWPTVLAALHESASPIRVQPVNQGTGAASLDYSVVDAHPGVRIIAVGGNSLSRGLTLEGLCVSYLLRNSKAYDTLLQMGRWFGYRDGYKDLCRVYLTEEAEGWYRHVADATNELKRDFSRMRRQKATPEEFGLRVRTHPDTLLITARNKMATGVDVVGERDISLAGRGIETARLYSDKTRNDENFRLVDRFLLGLGNTEGSPEQSRYGNALVWQNVPSLLIARLLEEFLVHPLNHDFQGDAISSFLRDAVERGDPQLAACTVALPTKGDGGLLIPELQSGLSVEAKKRSVLVRQMNSLLVSGKKARVGSRADVRYGLTVEQVEEVTRAEQEAKPNQKDVPEDSYRAAMDSPLLIMYLLRGVEGRTKDSRGTEFKSGLILPALGLHFPGTRDLNAPRRYIKYRLNRVAQDEFELDGEDLIDDADED